MTKTTIIRSQYKGQVRQENYLGSRYVSCFPTWLRFVIFLKGGLYQPGNWKIVWGRVFCWFDIHRIKTTPEIKRKDCIYCGYQKKIK